MSLVYSGGGGRGYFWPLRVIFDIKKKVPYYLDNFKTNYIILQNVENCPQKNLQITKNAEGK
jgi:hypothetical protein